MFDGKFGRRITQAILLVGLTITSLRCLAQPAGQGDSWNLSPPLTIHGISVKFSPLRAGEKSADEISMLQDIRVLTIASGKEVSADLKYSDPYRRLLCAPGTIDPRTHQKRDCHSEWEMLRDGSQFQVILDSNKLMVNPNGESSETSKDLLVKVGDRYGVILYSAWKAVKDPTSAQAASSKNQPMTPASAAALAAQIAYQDEFRNSPLPSSSSQKPFRSMLDNQTTPQKAAQLFWDAILTKCGDSYFYYSNEGVYAGGWKLTQYKDVTFSLEKELVSRADQLNGVQWSGTAHLRSSANRFISQNGRWSQWYDIDGKMGVTLTKRNNEWHFGDGDPLDGDYNVDAMSRNKQGCGVATSTNPFSSTR